MSQYAEMPQVILCAIQVGCEVKIILLLGCVENNCLCEAVSFLYLLLFSGTYVMENGGVHLEKMKSVLHATNSSVQDFLSVFYTLSKCAFTHHLFVMDHLIAHQKKMNFFVNFQGNVLWAVCVCCML